MPNTTALLPLLAALLLCAATFDAQAQWTWRDRNGRVNASDRPPPRDTPDKDILSRPAGESTRRTAPPAPQAVPGAASAAPAVVPAAPAGPSVKGPLDRELEARKRAVDQEQAAKARADEERLAGQRAENCRRARGQLVALESGQRMSRVNQKGEPEVLDDRGRTEETRQAREVIAADCR